MNDSGGYGPSLKSGGVNVIAGTLGSWALFVQAEDAIRYPLVTGVQTCALPIFWNTDGSGNLTSAIGSLTASSSALQSIETSFHQDLNGDGMIGLRSEERRVGKESRFT